MAFICSMIGLLMAGDSLTVSPKVAVVVDAETRARIAEAVITVDDREIGKTLWNGSFLIPDSFALLTIKKPGFLTRKLVREEITDTIELLNNGRTLNEVVVWGKRPSTYFKYTPPKGSDMMGVSSSSGVGFDFFKAIDNLFNFKKHKRRRKARKALDTL